MKRADLPPASEAMGCLFVREGGKHTVYRNPVTGSDYSSPTQKIKKHLARKICDDPGN